MTKAASIALPLACLAAPGQAADLPPRTDIVLRTPMTELQKKAYRAVEATRRTEVLEALGAGRSLEALEYLLRLRQAACHVGLLPGGVL